MDSAAENKDGAKGSDGPEETSLISGDVLVGGQAVIEGVMMRTPHAYAVAVRKPDGSIVREGHRITSLGEKYPRFKWPVVRGAAILGQSLVLGIRALNFSAAAMAENGAEGGKDSQDNGIPGWMLAVTLVFSALLGIALFILLPLFLAGQLRNQLALFENWLAFNLADGIMRLVIFIAYIAAMLLSRDIRRVFEYHGAEHKVVYNWEAKIPLSVDKASGYSRLHPRCGTSFLLMVMAVSILIFSLFKFKTYWLLAASRLILMPLIAGLSYELIRWSARQSRESLTFAAFRLGLLLQRMTTREPDPGQLEVAIAALNHALEMETQIAAERKAAA
jgi:uncharacterized protein YqhQ